jgi:PTS system fructose-specific IIC component
VLADAEGQLKASLNAQTASSALRIVGITSCPTGIAHTFMAAEGLSQAAQKLGHSIRVETQGSVGAQDTLTADEIRLADVVIIAADTQVDLSRFTGKRLFSSGTKPAINDGENLVRRAIAEAQPHGASQAASSQTAASTARKQRPERAAQRRLQTPDDRCVLHAALCHRGRHHDCAGVCAGRHLRL